MDKDSRNKKKNRKANRKSLYAEVQDTKRMLKAQAIKIKDLEAAVDNLEAFIEIMAGDIYMSKLKIVTNKKEEKSFIKDDWS